MKKLFSIGIAALCWSCVPPMSLYTALAASLLDGQVLQNGFESASPPSLERAVRLV